MNGDTKWALVTGASQGIGLELAKQFAEHGYDLVIAAEDGGINQAAEELAELGARVEPVQVDLRDAEGVKHLYEVATESGRSLDAAALNAGVGRGGRFVDTEFEDDLDIIELNVRSTTQLAKLVLRDMTARNSGKVLFTSSIASTMPGSYQPVYHASKSFVQALSEAVRDELRDTGVTVTALMPGPTATSFFKRAKLSDTRVGHMSKDDPAHVARQGFDALMAGKQKVVASSPSTKIMGALNRVTPDALKAKASRFMSTPSRSG
jgi:short-subunit dehydrogenase